MKAAFIILLVIIAVFVALIFTGSRTNVGGASPGNASDAQDFNADNYPAVAWLGATLGKFSPKLTAAQIQPSIAHYSLLSQPSYSLNIVADAKHKFRSAKFAVPVIGSQRCAHLIYKSAGAPPTGLDNLKEQDSENLGGSDKKTPKTEVTFTILSSGGEITIARNSPSPQACVVQLADER
jgi:hypothetical protein